MHIVRCFVAVAALAGCAHLPPAATTDVPPPWPAPRADAGTPPPDAAEPPGPRLPPRASSPPSSGSGIQTLPGGAVMKPGSPPPVVPLAPPPEPSK